MTKREVYERKTFKNYGLFHVSSAVQKAIRRGEEDIAMYFTVELFNSGLDEYLWKRLKIITSEDVGLAEPTMPAQIQALYEMYLDQKKKSNAVNAKKRPERLFLTHAVLLLCRCRKSRLNDWSVIYYWREHDNRRVEIPDYAFDKHNIEGRRMGRGWKHFFQEGSHLENHRILDGEEEMMKKAWEEVNKEEGKTLFNDIDQESLPDEDILNN